jgi:hypothetical protein
MNQHQVRDLIQYPQHLLLEPVRPPSLLVEGRKVADQQAVVEDKNESANSYRQVLCI